MGAYDWLNFPVTHGFYPAYDANTPDTPHYAIDIGTPFHTPITAIESGTVVQADYAAWGGEIFIKPDDGSTEYYVYHLDENNVAAGQHVNAGDIIGSSGGENPGYPGALHPASAVWSTGPHTHVGFFTNWTDTPIGTRPQGPNISALIQNIKTGKVDPGVAPITPTTPMGASSGALAGAGFPTIPAVPDVQAGIQSGLVRAGLFLIVLLFFGAGLYIAFKDQINSGVSTAAKVGAKAVLL